jgi:eukaryotic-like serine/threonine-protein kinase
VPLDVGTTIGRYTIVRLIAQGGMAEVYRADQELTSGITRPVAVKVIRPEYSESDDFRQMFLDEARTACTLSHPNIAHIYEVGETDDRLLYMAMELVPGETLATIARTLRQHDQRLSDEALFAVGILTCSALEAVHALTLQGGTVNLVHRDVSPHNLLLSAQGGLKLIDFGIAKAATNRNLTMPGVTKGKAGYFSPEQAMGKRLDGRSDLFSLGVTLYKLASGATPFDEHTAHAERHAALVHGRWKSLQSVYPGLAPGFYHVVNTALAVEPTGRFGTAFEMRDALEKAAFDEGLRVGTSALLGYLTPDGDVTASGGARRPAAPSTQNLTRISAEVPQAKPPPAVTDPQFHTTATRVQPQRGLMALAFFAALAIGAFGVLLLTRATGEPPATREAPAIRVEPPVVAALPPLEELPVVEAVGPVVVPVDAGLAGALAKPAPPSRRPKPPVMEQPKPAPAEKATAVVVAEEIPPGEGKVAVSATDNTVVAAVLLGSTDVGQPPVMKKVSSGHYTVVVKLADGRRSPPWKGAIRPSDYVRLKFDVAAWAWSRQ